MNTEYKKYLKSEEWAALKIDLFNHRGRACEKCSSKTNIQVHHLHYENIFKEEPEDLIILCKKCHYKEHYHKPKKIVKRKTRKVKVLSLAMKVELKKRNKKAYRRYVKKLKAQE